MNSNILGIDIGSVSISVAEISPKREIIRTAYEPHHGKITDRLKKILSNFDMSQIYGIASTSSTPPVVSVNQQYDNRVSVIAAARHFHDRIGTILIVGGEKFGAIWFDEDGNYLNFKANTSCAAGTGSFLDQQAKRLNLAGIEELSEIAFNNNGPIPKIASRCAVFAKTDLVHAQQEGHTLEEICDGLCHGLAKNIVDTLFIGEKPTAPIIFTGGVSKNKAVVRHIQAILGKAVITDQTYVYGAIGAAFSLLDELPLHKPLQITSADDILIHKASEKRYFHDPLDLKLSDHPDFDSIEKYEHTPFDEAMNSDPVEVDIYEVLKPSRQYEAYMGIDIGSTSTKAILVDKDRVVLAGFYTKTAGRPVNALQKLFAAIEDMVEAHALQLQIMGSGTTGSGRKFVGKLVAADLVIDEITTHARAACELRPDVDTIIEIGGQDSKFTTLKNGRVTFSAMNAVCAAGTGSFIEEQAHKLRCPLSDYASRTAHQRSPIASDRCTVFMERDINHYLSEGYSANEVLASVLHSIRENYLSKVAIESNIGDTVCFQGATAKNRSLVAAFEQRLGKPIYVSEYCHLTGALGVALTLLDQSVSKTTFRGTNLWKKHIPIHSQVCQLCTNHCKITIADVDKERVAYGFLCGRDYDTQKYVNNNLSGFDLLRQRKKVFSFNRKKEYHQEFTIGIPAALHLHEDLWFWKKFFDALSIRTVTSEPCTDAIKQGRQIANAEFCAPMTALHGHAAYLMDRSDHIFLPVCLEKKAEEKRLRRQYCYYTQFSSTLVSVSAQNSDASEGSQKNRFLMPLVSYLYSSFHAKVELYYMLKSISKPRISFFDVSSAYDTALEYRDSCLEKLKETYKNASQKSGALHVVFLGRPYTILSKSMNKGIPGIFASLGVKVFFQDMLSYEKADVESLGPLLKELHWHYASKVMEAAEVVAQSKTAYPVFITSFKCSPDAFVSEYFKKLMDAHEKPYLILQLDEHDSSVGYETRIEAAIRAFRNHYDQTSQVPKTWDISETRTSPRFGPWLVPVRETDLSDKILLIPNWDNISLKLLAANLRREGLDARLMEESETSIQKSLRHNTGQCIPLNILAQDFIDYVETHHLDPAKTVLWMVESWMACNIRLFPHHIRSLLNAHGNGMEHAGVYAGNLSFMDVSMKLPVNNYFAYMFGGLIRKMGCKIRPYERNKGETDQIIRKSVGILTDAFAGNRSKEDALDEVVSCFERIERTDESGLRPKVAIFGDLYVRDNDVINQDIIHFIEDNGGEVITMPYSEYGRMVASPYYRKWFAEGHYMSIFSSKVLLTGINRLEKRYYKYFERILNEPQPEYDESPEKILSEHNVRIENTGESMDNILKIHYMKKHYPDVSLFVQTSPGFCCPSLVTEAMAKHIEQMTGVPIVSVTYDGTSGMKNDVIIPYLRYPRRGCPDENLRYVSRVGL